MSFQKCHAELNVPYDPYLDNVFDGEETSRGIRFFTHGYDVYTPDKVLVTHDYEGHQSNPVIHTWGRKNGKQGEIDAERKAKFDTVDWSFMDHIQQLKGTVTPDGVERINILMGLNNVPAGMRHALHDKPGPEALQMINEGRFGLGNARTLDQAYEFAGFSPQDMKMHANKCGNLKWVPFEDKEDFNEKNDWGVAINLQRKIWNEAEPLLPPPPGGGSSGGGGLASQSRSLNGGSAAASVHIHTHGSTYHVVGWIFMFVLVAGGFLHRAGFLKPKKSARLND